MSCMIASDTRIAALARWTSPVILGIVPATPGLYIAPATPLIADRARICQSSGRPVRNRTAVVPWVRTLATSAPTIMRRGVNRSISTPPNRISSTNGRLVAARASPTPVAP